MLVILVKLSNLTKVMGQLIAEVNVFSSCQWSSYVTITDLVISC